jgi:hypothetical protein
MSLHEESERELAADERRWIDALGEAFRPEPMERARASAFRRALEERIERRRRRMRVGAPLLALASGAAALWLYVAAPAPVAEPVAGASLYAFADPDSASADLAPPEGYLPDDYRLLASLIDEESAR